MTSEDIRRLVQRAAGDTAFLERLIAEPQSVGAYGLAESLPVKRPEDLLGLRPAAIRAGCGDGPTCGVTCSHTCSGGYTMSCGGTCDATCDYTASMSRQ